MLWTFIVRLLVGKCPQISILTGFEGSQGGIILGRASKGTEREFQCSTAFRTVQ